MKKSKKKYNKNGENYYKLYDEAGKEIGRINPIFEKKQFAWLKGVSVFVLTEDGMLVLEKRSNNTALTPSDIDLVSGHKDGEEKGKKTAYRELKEELGIKKKKILKLKKIKRNVPLVFKGNRNFFLNFYVTKLKEHLGNFDFQTAEVEDIMVIPMQEGFDLIRQSKTKFPYVGNEEKFEEIFEKVKMFYQKSTEIKTKKSNKSIEKDEGEAK